MNPTPPARPLAQALAVESQIRLPGSAGRILKQIRDIESIAPLFREAGLVKAVARPAVIDLSISGVATRSVVKRALGGFVYASQAQEQANGRLPEVHTGADIEDWSDEELDEALGRVNVFARVEPIQKTRLVERLKANNEIVAVLCVGTGLQETD